jgi:universal stress protein E
VDLDAVEQPAVEKAARLAAAFGATLELCVFDEGEGVPGSWAGGTTLAQFRGVLRERMLSRLAELCAPYRASGLDVSLTYAFRSPGAHALATRAIRSGASLVVKSVSARASHEDESDGASIAELPMPLLLVRSGQWDVQPHVVMSVDPCHQAQRPIELDEAVLGVGGSVSRALGGISSAIHVLEGPSHLPGDRVAAGARSDALERQRYEVLDLASRASLDDREVRFTEQRVPDGIVALAAEIRPAILVMGSAARQRPDAPDGGTASEVVKRVACDVLVVKPPGFVSPLMVAE